MKLNKRELKSSILDVVNEITSDIDHGECFFEETLLKSLHNNLDLLKELSNEYYISNLG